MESNPRKQWTAIKNLKKRSPDKDGNRVGPSRRAEAIAEYLHELQKEPALPPRKAFRPNVVQDQLEFHTGPIDSRELDIAIRNAKAIRPQVQTTSAPNCSKFLPIQIGRRLIR